MVNVVWTKWPMLCVANARGSPRCGGSQLYVMLCIMRNICSIMYGWSSLYKIFVCCGVDMHVRQSWCGLNGQCGVSRLPVVTIVVAAHNYV